MKELDDIAIRIAGANGDGIETSGEVLARVLKSAGYNIFAYRSYQSIIRGGHVWYQVRFGSRELHSFKDKADILIAINQDAIDNQIDHLSNDAVIIYDSKKMSIDKYKDRKIRFLDIPMLDISIENGGDPVLRNIVGIGAALRLCNVDISYLNDYITKRFSKKGETVVNNNISCAREGYSRATPLFNVKADPKVKDLYLINGNEALALGAFAANCRFYAAYPMTPASSILHWFAANADKGIVVKQTEDEIAAINAAIGAASAGARAMCGTSGGGFSLMVEALGLAGMIEVPLVVVESQRAGPSTGLPTKTEQGDLLFVAHASQGDFPRVVMSPRSVREGFYMGAQAFNLAEKYQCPVIILLDLYYSEHMRTISIDNLDIKIERGKLIKEKSYNGRFKRYSLEEDGISYRSIPGTPGLEFVAPSDEHDEYGNLISDYYAGIDQYVELRRKMHEKRMRKIDTMIKQENIFKPEIEKEGDIYLVTFGSTTESAREAIIEFEKQSSYKIGLISFPYLLPLDKDKTRDMLKDKNLIDVECNYSGQLAQLIAANTGVVIKDSIRKYDGEAMTEQYIIDRLNQIVKR
ncbi:MAG: 2-oxoacid:ferredoxin oxidoreductase subunit alpha [Candidatus Micrarchaeota archaeon]|nr:MAG: 2-oxoacid:ferredoxin oxidoreductase subunit alpha [Candidatus Micrarchaeota archaeon]